MTESQRLFLVQARADFAVFQLLRDHSDLPAKESGTPLIALPGRERKRGQFVWRFGESLPRSVCSVMLVKRVEPSIDLEPI